MPVQVQTLAEWVEQGVPGMLSIVMPAQNEQGRIERTIRELITALEAAGITHEILVVNDNSRDRTREILVALSQELPTLRFVDNDPPSGYGFAVRTGLAHFRGDVVATVMADASDPPEDIVRFYQKVVEGFDCVFGSRFIRGGRTVDYPMAKLIVNRIGNLLIRSLFLMQYNDVTNAFKMYRRKVIGGIQPILSCHFNITVELPLKAIVRGYSYAVLPNSWINRAEDVSKFHIREMGSRYLFIILYCYFEKLLSRQDYRHQSGRLQVWSR